MASVGVLSCALSMLVLVAFHQGDLAAVTQHASRYASRSCSAT
ncbi:hypothetical protein [Saccharothrix deserti]|nr:hypothetical protein [Saccharothrix deserti]